MSVYMKKSTEWIDEEGAYTEYFLSGELREDILKRLLRPIEALTTVRMIKATSDAGVWIEIFVHPFGEPDTQVFTQKNNRFQDMKDAQENLFAWMFEQVAN